MQGQPTAGHQAEGAKPAAGEFPGGPATDGCQLSVASSPGAKGRPKICAKHRNDESAIVIARAARAIVLVIEETQNLAGRSAISAAFPGTHGSPRCAVCSLSPCNEELFQIESLISRKWKQSVGRFVEPSIEPVAFRWPTSLCHRFVNLLTSEVRSFRRIALNFIYTDVSDVLSFAEISVHHTLPFRRSMRTSLQASVLGPGLAPATKGSRIAWMRAHSKPKVLRRRVRSFCRHGVLVLFRNPASGLQRSGYNGSTEVAAISRAWEFEVMLTTYLLRAGLRRR
jgi:hypothetical protein